MDYNIIMTHSPYGEYTRHRRHEETSKAVISLWHKGLITTDEIWMFAYKDSGKGGSNTAHMLIHLSEDIWRKKYYIITEIYGFDPQSYEANATLKEEAFWRFPSLVKFQKWLETRRMQ
jgi:hypothetical protein